MQPITKLILRVKAKSTSSAPPIFRLATLMSTVDDKSIKVNWSTEPTTYTTYLCYRHWKPTCVYITYANGSLSIVDLNSVTEDKAWRKINTLLRKKLMQSALTDETTPVPKHNTYDSLHQGIGGRKRWVIKNEYVHHNAIQQVLEKNYHSNRAIVITPNSEVDMLLKEAYTSRRLTGNVIKRVAHE